MLDPTVIAIGLTDLQTWLPGTLTTAVSAVSADLTIYAVGVFSLAVAFFVTLSMASPA